MMCKLKTRYSAKALTSVVLIMCSMLFAAWMLCARGYGKGWMDDFAYSRVFASWMTNDRIYFLSLGHEIQGLGDILDSIRWHYMYLNGRLANFLMLFYSQVPAWLGPLLHGVVYGFLIAGIMRLGLGRRWRFRPLALSCMVALVWVTFPWWDMHASADFIFNYVWSGAACLWSWVVMFSPSERGRLRWLWLVIPAAMMHEGISAVMDVGIVVHVLMSWKTYASHRRLLTLPVAFVLFSMVPTLSPGILKLAHESAPHTFNDQWVFYELIFKNSVVILSTLVSLVVCYRRKELQTGLLFLSMVVASTLICYMAGIAGRAYWSAYLVFAVEVAYIFRNVRIGRRLSALLACVVTATVCVWGAVLCRYQWRTSLERDAAIEELRAGHPEGPYVLTHVTKYNELPWWLFNIVATIADNDEAIYAYVYADIYQKDSVGFCVVMPAAATLTQSMESMPLLPSGLCGDKYCFISKKRHAPALFTFTFEATPAAGEPGWHPFYSLRRFKEPVIFKTLCCETGLKLADGDSVYVYRPIRVPRSLWNHKMLDVEPADE